MKVKGASVAELSSYRSILQDSPVATMTHRQAPRVRPGTYRYSYTGNRYTGAFGERSEPHPAFPKSTFSIPNNRKT